MYSQAPLTVWHAARLRVEQGTEAFGRCTLHGNGREDMYRTVSSRSLQCVIHVPVFKLLAL